MRLHEMVDPPGQQQQNGQTDLDTMAGMSPQELEGQVREIDDALRQLDQDYQMRKRHLEDSKRACMDRRRSATQQH